MTFVYQEVRTRNAQRKDYREYGMEKCSYICQREMKMGRRFKDIPSEYYKKAVRVVQ